MAVNIVTRSVDIKFVRVDPPSRTKHGVPIRYELVRCLSNAWEDAKKFPQASHTVPMARRARLAAGTSAMKYKRTEIEQENKKTGNQEMGNNPHETIWRTPLPRRLNFTYFYGRFSLFLWQIICAKK
jgi:hypothetical protein